MNKKTEYNNFLKSDIWKFIKSKYKQNRCDICNSDKYLILHHMDYEKEYLNKTINTKDYIPKSERKILYENMLYNRDKLNKEFYTTVNF